MASGQHSGRLTTHVLDTAAGCPAAGLKIELVRIENGERQPLREVATNNDGRCDALLLEGEEFRPGVYEPVFHAGGHPRTSGVALPDPAFLDVAPIRFGIADAGQHHHVPHAVAAVTTHGAEA